MVERLRHRAAAFVDGHAELFVTVEDDGTLMFGGDDQAGLFRAAAEWLEEDPACTVAGVAWGPAATEPPWTLALHLRHPGPPGD
ncbi:hypothetical protein [Streptomyces sp. RPT161]|uniref:hypothetical protein n=1 Tax=Streptomyces sp. RPT161 TaxID=3015993 RepID=UPI0022B86C1B|nr:hypothetical protein [Streptomyces sp. RPT161]